MVRQTIVVKSFEDKTGFKSGKPYREYITNIGKATTFPEQYALIDAWGSKPVDVDWVVKGNFNNITRVFGAPDVGSTSANTIPVEVVTDKPKRIDTAGDIRLMNAAHCYSRLHVSKENTVFPAKHAAAWCREFVRHLYNPEEEVVE